MQNFIFSFCHVENDFNSTVMYNHFSFNFQNDIFNVCGFQVKALKAHNL